MKILVTGGSGFIGSHVVDRLLAAGHDVRVFDHRPSPHRNGEVETVVGDVRDIDDVRAAVDGCEVAIHLAARADVDEVLLDPIGAEAVNAQGTLTVVEAARTSGTRRVVYASTIWVYGEQRNGVADEETKIGVPRHFYTATKLAGEAYCRSYSELYGLEHTILRFGIPYGPRARPAGVLPTFVRRALAGEPLELAGDGGQSRRFVYVSDLADGVAHALAPVAANRTYNLVGEEDVTVRAIAEHVRALVAPVDIVRRPRRPGDFDGVVVSGERAKRELGWRASTTYEEGARRYVDWFRAEHAS